MTGVRYSGGSTVLAESKKHVWTLVLALVLSSQAKTGLCCIVTNETAFLKQNVMQIETNAQIVHG